MSQLNLPTSLTFFVIQGALSALLVSNDETHWRAWMLDVQPRLKDSDYSGVELLLQAYGGMGSFNDLVLGQSYDKGVFAWKPGHQEINDELDRLRGKASELARAIRREHEIPAHVLHFSQGQVHR